MLTAELEASDIRIVQAAACVLFGDHDDDG